MIMENLHSFVGRHWILFSIGLLLVAIFIYDLTQKRHTILHNFPILGHLRFLLERIGPEFRQYIVSNDKEEMPFNRDERRWVYASAKGQNNTFGFGTTEQIYNIGYPVIKHATFPYPEHKVSFPENDKSYVPAMKVIGERHNRKMPYFPRSLVNISAMSFGSLGYRAVSAINLGAKEAKCYQNTGEGGLSPYHLLGADVVWQLGTGYFGARDSKGGFSIELVAEKTARYPEPSRSNSHRVQNLVRAACYLEKR